MGERPILFSAPMVRAILAGKKTQTRRIVKNEFGSCAECFAAAVPHNDGDGGMGIFGTAPYLRVAACTHAGDLAGGRTRCPYGAVGDRMWVKETYASEKQVQAGTGAVRWEHPDGKRCGALYRADAIRESAPGKGWKPSIHMPRCLSRIDLEIVCVRIERLHDITEHDARAEGVELGKKQPALINGEPGKVVIFDPRKAFAVLWDQINGERAPWSTNPWLWVVEFKRVRP